jgi:hypothetical protein
MSEKIDPEFVRKALAHAERDLVALLALEARLLSQLGHHVHLKWPCFLEPRDGNELKVESYALAQEEIDAFTRRLIYDSLPTMTSVAFSFLERPSGCLIEQTVHYKDVVFMRDVSPDSETLKNYRNWSYLESGERPPDNLKSGYIEGVYQPLKILSVFGTPLTPGRSPSGRFELREAPFPYVGQVISFDGAILGESLGDLKFLHLYELQKFKGEKEWMSNIPCEVYEIQQAVSEISGTVIIAGLGMGMMLSAARKKEGVTHITLIEQSQELVGWILPRLDVAADKVIIGDAMLELPRLEADWALVDIFEAWGTKAALLDKLKATCPGINNWWVWGNEHHIL